MPPLVLLPLGCLLGAVLGLLLLLAIARRHGDLVLLLLTGFILSSLFLGIGNFLMSLSQEKWELGRAMVAFVLGGLSGTSFAQVAIALPLVLAGVVAAFLWGRALDVLLSGEEEAAALGVDVRAARRWSVLWSATLTGAAVSLGGNIGFVALIVPHGLRSLHRQRAPAARARRGARRRAVRDRVRRDRARGAGAQRAAARRGHRADRRAGVPRAAAAHLARGGLWLSRSRCARGAGVHASRSARGSALCMRSTSTPPTAA